MVSRAFQALQKFMTGQGLKLLDAGRTQITMPSQAPLKWKLKYGILFTCGFVSGCLRGRTGVRINQYRDAQYKKCEAEFDQWLQRLESTGPEATYAPRLVKKSAEADRNKVYITTT